MSLKQLVQSGSGKPIRQQIVSQHSESKKIIPLDNLSSSLFTGDNEDTVKFSPNSIKKWYRARLQINVKESGGSNPVTVAPVFNWFRRIELWDKDGAGVRLWRMYPDEMLFKLVALKKSDELSEEYLESLGLNESLQAHANNHIDASGTKTFYLPLHDVFHYNRDQSNIGYMQNVKGGDFELRLFTRNAVASGSGTLNLVSVKLIIEQQDAPMVTSQGKELASYVYRSVNYLDPVIKEEKSQTLTAGTTYESFSLEHLSGYCSGFLLSVRADSYSNTSNGMLKYLDLGHDAEFDIVDNGGNSIIGSGSMIPISDWVANDYDRHMNTRFIHKKKLYLIPFCKNIAEAMHGVSNGHIKFNGEKWKLHIKPGSAGISTVHSVDLTGTADADYYRFAHKGDMTNSLAYNASVGAMKSALEALPSFKNHGHKPLTVTASGTATADFTLTYDSTNAPVNEAPVRVVCESVNDAGVEIFASESVSTYGKTGWTTGSGYTVTLTALMQKTLCKNEGVLAVKQKKV